MSSPENLTHLLWEQAVANEDWEEAKRLESHVNQVNLTPEEVLELQLAESIMAGDEDLTQQLRAELSASSKMDAVLPPGLLEQRAIIRAETYWGIGQTATRHGDGYGPRDIM